MYKLVKVEVSLENASLSRQNPGLDIEAREIGYTIAAFIETAAIIADSDDICRKIVDTNGNSVGIMKVSVSKEEPTCSC